MILLRLRLNLRGKRATQNKVLSNSSIWWVAMAKKNNNDAFDDDTEVTRLASSN